MGGIIAKCDLYMMDWTENIKLYGIGMEDIVSATSVKVFKNNPTTKILVPNEQFSA